MDMQEIRCRPFEDADFDALAGILRGYWHEEGPEGAYRELEAADDLVWCLSRSTFSRVAVMGDEPIGVVLACAGEVEDAWCERWEAEAERVFERMAALAPDACAARLRFSETEGRVNEALLRELISALSAGSMISIRSSEDAPNANQALSANQVPNASQAPDTALGEITLLAVSPRAAGKGVGSALLDAARAYLVQQGVTTAFLYTDTSCNWRFYERHGLVRAAVHHAAPEECGIIDSELYLYRWELTSVPCAKRAARTEG